MTFDDWPPGALATFIAALIAGGAGLVSTVVTLADGAASRRRVTEQTQREQWWTRWSFAVEKVLSADPIQREVGLVIMDALADMPWLSHDDRRIGLVIADAVVETNRTDGDGDGRGPDA